MLTEEYYARKGATEFFINPSQKEMMEAGKKWGLRFIAYKKDLYIWSAYGSILHDDFWDSKGRDVEDDIYNGDLIAGYLELKGGKWKLVDLDGAGYTSNYLSYKDNLNRTLSNFKWLNNYFDFRNINNFIYEDKAMNIIKRIDVILGETTVTGDVAQNTAKGCVDIVGKKKKKKSVLTGKPKVGDKGE